MSPSGTTPRSLPVADDTDPRLIPNTSEHHRRSNYISADSYELAPNIPRNYIAPMSEEDWMNKSERDTITIIHHSSTENESTNRRWYEKK